MHGKDRGYRGNKTVVVGAMQCGGNICLKVVRRTERESLHGFIRENKARTKTPPRPTATNTEARIRLWSRGSVSAVMRGAWTA